MVKDSTDGQQFFAYINTMISARSRQKKQPKTSNMLSNFKMNSTPQNVTPSLLAMSFCWVPLRCRFAARGSVCNSLSRDHDYWSSPLGGHSMGPFLRLAYILYVFWGQEGFRNDPEPYNFCLSEYEQISIHSKRGILQQRLKSSKYSKLNSKFKIANSWACKKF